MKRAVVVGVAAFLLGTAFAPAQAGRSDEVLDLLCSRFDAAGGKAFLRVRGAIADEMQRQTGKRDFNLDEKLDIVRMINHTVCVK